MLTKKQIQEKLNDFQRRNEYFFDYFEQKDIVRFVTEILKEGEKGR